MRKSKFQSAIFTIGICLGAALTSCSSSDEPEITSSTPSSEKPDIRSVEEACNIAISFLEAGNDAPDSRSISAIDNVKIAYGAGSRSGSADTLFYSVNLSNNAGFVLVSAPKAAEPVLAYVDEGSYDPAKSTDNSGFNLFIEKSKEYTAFAAQRAVSLDPKPIEQPYNLISKASPKINIKWGQRYPEGLFCLNGISGCVQTAMAQALSYFEQPTSIELTYPGHDKDRVNLNWSEIKKHSISCGDANTGINDSLINSHLQNCEASEESHKALAYLCRELGYRNKADANGGAYSIDANSTYAALLPTRTVTPAQAFTSQCFEHLFLTMKNSNAVAHFSGYTSLMEGHAWVCEGGRDYEYHSRIYYTDGKEYIIHTYYFYFNWGAQGRYNGYFLAGVFDTEKSLREIDLPGLTFDPMSRADFSNYVDYYMIY